MLIAYSVTVPEVVILQTRLPFVAWYSVNQRFVPSEPMASGCEPAVIPELYSVTVPLVVILPILVAPSSANQRLPSGPAQIE